MSSHSATAMGDQVFVYKLTKTGGWSVTTRDASIKEINVASGSKLGVSWSSNKVTLSNTMTADDMPMSSSDATTAKSAIDTLNNNIAERTYFCYKETLNGTTFTVEFDAANEHVTAFAFGRYGYTPAKLSMSIITFNNNGEVYVKSFGDESLSASLSGNTVTFTTASTYARIMFICNAKMT